MYHMVLYILWSITSFYHHCNQAQIFHPWELGSEISNNLPLDHLHKFGLPQHDFVMLSKSLSLHVNLSKSAVSDLCVYVHCIVLCSLVKKYLAHCIFSLPLYSLKLWARNGGLSVTPHL